MPAAARIVGRDLLFAQAARRIALDGGKIFGNLRELVLQRRSLAQQPQHGLPAGLKRSGTILQILLQTLALGALDGQPFARRFGLRFKRRERLEVSLQFLLELCLPFLQLLRFRFALGEPLLDGADLLRLRIQLAARPGLFQFQIRQLFARQSQCGVIAITGFLKLNMFFLPLGYLIGKILEFRVGEIQIERRFGGLALQHPIAAGERYAKLRHHLGLQLFVALGLGRLALQRIHLPADFFEDVEHARQILLGAFQLGFRQPLPGFELGDAGGLFDHGAAVLRAIAEDLADAALLDDGVAFRAPGRCP